MLFKNPLLEKKYKQIHKDFVREFKKLPKFFSKMPTPALVKKEMQYYWPKKHYAGEYYFEGWPTRDLLEQAMVLGYLLGKNAKAYFKQRNKVHQLSKELNNFKFNISTSKREFYGVGMDKVWEKEGQVVYSKLGQEYTVKASLKDFEKAWKKWEKKALKIYS